MQQGSLDNIKIRTLNSQIKINFLAVKAQLNTWSCPVCLSVVIFFLFGHLSLLSYAHDSMYTTVSCLSTWLLHYGKTCKNFSNKQNSEIMLFFQPRGPLENVGGPSLSSLLLILAWNRWKVTPHFPIWRWCLILMVLLVYSKAEVKFVVN